MKAFFKKIVFLKLLLFVNLSLYAPSRPSLPVENGKTVEPFKRLINAIGLVETGHDTLAYNPLEEAAGYFQIRPIRLLDYNIRTGSNYKMNDLYNYEISEKIFMYYASQIGPYDFETIARRWNGSGSMTIEYWKKVKANL